MDVMMEYRVGPGAGVCMRAAAAAAARGVVT